MTYTSLVSDVQNYLERTDSSLVASIPNFIAMAEARLARELKILGFIRPVTSTLTIGDPIIAKPSNWRETVCFNVGTSTGLRTRKEIYPRTYEFARAVSADPTNTGEPRFYSDYDYSHWLISPTPDQAYPFEVLYYELVPPLDDSNQTNYLTQVTPDLLLYATLLQSAPYLKNDQRIPTWQAYYDRALQAENGMDMRQILDRAMKASEG
jgi:hypothetical protein